MSGDPRALLRALVLESGQRWGDISTDFQRADADAILDLSGPRLHVCTRPRGGSKTTDLAGVGIAALLDQAPPGSRSYWVAVDADQADLGVDAMRGFISRTPGLSGLLDLRVRRVVNKATGASLEVLPADGASAWGLIPWLTIVDEAAAWPATRKFVELWSAVVSGVPKAGPTGRLVCLTSAGDPGHWFAKILAHAKASDAWRVSEVPGPLPWRTEADLAEQRVLLTESQFARLHLNRWTAPEDRLALADDVDRCVGHEGVLAYDARERYVMTLDVGLTNDATVLVLGHLSVDGVVVVDRIERWRGSKGRPVDLDLVESTIATLADAYRARIVADPYQAQHLLQRLRSRGYRADQHVFSQTSNGRLALTLYRVIRDRQIDLPNDAELLDELKNVRLVETSVGNVRLDHDAGRHDDQAVAVGLLAVSLLEGRRKRRRGIVSVHELEAEARELAEATRVGEHPSTHGRGAGVFHEWEELV